MSRRGTKSHPNDRFQTQFRKFMKGKAIGSCKKPGRVADWLIYGVLVQSISSDFSAESGERNPKLLGDLGFVSIIFLKVLLDQFLFERFRHFLAVLASANRFKNRFRSVVDLDEFSGPEYAEAFNEVPEFPHVTGPIVMRQSFHGVW